jgi:retinoid hydroxylase
MPAPPGDLGLPFLGEALPFLKDPFTFMTARTARHGNVWKTRILGDTVVFFTGPDAFRFFMNPDNFTRTKGSPPHMQDLFHADAVPFIDGDRFRIRKRLLNLAFTPDAMASYLPGLEALAARYLSAWADQPEVRLNGELARLAFDTANVLFAGADPTVRNDAVAKDFDTFVGGMFAPPVSLPWSRFSQAKRARDRLRAYIKEAVGKGGAGGTVLGVLKGAKLPTGEQLSDDELRIELLHFFSAVVSPFSGVLAWTIVGLATHPEVIARATEEVRASIGPGPVDTAAIEKLAYVRAFSREVRRAYPIVPLTFFGVAQRDLEYGGHSIQKGWKAAGAIWPTLQDGKTFADPAAFRPERMADDAFAKLPDFAYVPQGAGPRDGHRCPGDLLVDLLVPQLVALLLRDYELTLPAQDLAPRPAGIGPMPKGGLRATIKRRG